MRLIYTCIYIYVPAIHLDERGNIREERERERSERCTRLFAAAPRTSARDYCLARQSLSAGRLFAAPAAAAAVFPARTHTYIVARKGVTFCLLLQRRKKRLYTQCESVCIFYSVGSGDSEILYVVVVVVICRGSFL